MRNFLFIVLTCCIGASAPSYAGEIPVDVQKEAMLLTKKQETIALGNNRFLIFSGSLNDDKQYGFTIDLVEIQNGTPRFDPLFMEDFDPETQKHTMSLGAAFFAQNYHYDKITNALNYTSVSSDNMSRLQYRYVLEGDTLTLNEVLSQKIIPCQQEPCKKALPQAIFKAGNNAQTH